MPSSLEIAQPEEFALTMQQLVAEAEKTGLPEMEEDVNASLAGSAQLAALDDRLTALERTIAAGFEKMATANREGQPKVAEELARIDAHLLALSQVESVNQRLFNSLHQELDSYRDNFLRESLQKPFIRDLVILFDDLSNLSTQLERADASNDAGSQWSANLRNGLHALLEILHRMEVTEIEPKEFVDRRLHRIVSCEPADFAEDDGRIVMRVKRGFIWREQVLRPEEVVAKRLS